MSILTLSHEMGAGGPEIGQQVAEQLGYKYVDHELITDTAHRYGLLEEKLEHLDESKPSLFERFDAETRHGGTGQPTDRHGEGPARRHREGRADALSLRSGLGGSGAL